MTVIVGASCSDGIVIVGDRKFTYRNKSTKYGTKLFGDLRHVIIGFAGGEVTEGCHEFV